MVRGADRPGAHAMTQGRPYALQRSTNCKDLTRSSSNSNESNTDAFDLQHLRKLQHARGHTGGINCRTCRMKKCTSPFLLMSCQEDLTMTPSGGPPCRG
eukprot:scaffold45353_cov61-Phaeocystis_antarctica.AAC.8